jgi:hypothetical protein
VLVTLDDLHRADDETLRLLRMVATGAGAGLLVVGTHRSEEDTAALHATWAALATVVSDRLPLGGLAPDAVGALLARHGLRADAATAAAVADRTGGNPLFVREVARLAVTTGEDGLPAGVRDVLRRRLRELPGCSRAVLAHVALLGRSADVDLVLAVEAAVTGRTTAEIEEEVLDGLEDAVAAGVLGEDDGARTVRFVHDLWREVVADEIPRLRRARRHARILDVLEAGVAGPASPGALAHHALAAGDRVAPDRMLAHVAAAADAAMARGAFRSAVALCRRALAVASDGPAVIPLRCALVAALAASGAGEHAHTERGIAVDAARETGVPELVARALTSLDAPMPWPVRGTGGRMAPLFAELLDRPLDRPLDDEMRTRLLLAYAREVEFVEPARAAALADEALRRARASGPTRLLCTALNTAFLVNSQPEWWDRIEPVGREMLETAQAGGHADHRAEAHHVLFCAAVVRDDPAAARQHADAALAAATDGQLEMTLAFVGLHDAMLALTRGHADLAERTYAEEGDRLAAAGVPHAVVLLEVARFTLGLARGDTSGSLPALRRIDGAFPHYAHDLLALALLDAGHEQEARALWAQRLPVPRDWSWGGLLTVQGLVAARLGDRERGAEAFAALEPYAGRWGLSVTGILAFAPIDLVLARLARTLGHGDEAVAAHLARALTVVGDAGPWRERVSADCELLPLDVRG